MATEVVPLHAEQAVTLLTEPAAFAERFGWRLVTGWEIPRALEQVTDALEAGVEPRWLAHLVVDPEAGEVVGMGGFHSPPVDGEVEIGYRVAPARRGRGHAVAAVRAWLAQASAARLRRVVARTTHGATASAAVLVRCGFTRDGEDGGGSAWSWSPDTPAPSSAVAEEGAGGRAGAAARLFPVDPEDQA